MLTTVIAVVGLVLAAASLGWQGYTFSRSGSRVLVEARLGVFMARAQLRPIDTDDNETFLLPPNTIFDVSESLLRERVSPADRAIATVRNTGRLPVTVESCIWQSERAKAFETSSIPPGVALPKPLAEHDVCISAIDLGTVVSLLDGPAAREREVWPVVALGNGRKVRGNSLRIPAGVEPGPQTTINVKLRKIPDDLGKPSVISPRRRAVVRRRRHPLT